MDYEKWTEKLEAVEALQVDRSTQRAIYILPCGTRLYEDTHFPYNWFKSITNTVWVDVVLKESIAMIRLLKKFNAKLVDVYTNKGYGVPFFYGDDSMKNAFLFMEQAQSLIEEVWQTECY